MSEQQKKSSSFLINTKDPDHKLDKEQCVTVWAGVFER